VTKDDEKQLIAIHERITDCFLRLEALRVSLEEAGFPRELFEKNLAMIQAQWAERYQEHLVDYLRGEKEKLTRLLLELHEGRPQ
jgi:hypothetical protein